MTTLLEHVRIENVCLISALSHATAAGAHWLLFDAVGQVEPDRHFIMSASRRVGTLATRSVQLLVVSTVYRRPRSAESLCPAT
jgi:hypothetical protein